MPATSQVSLGSQLTVNPRYFLNVHLVQLVRKSTCTQWENFCLASTPIYILTVLDTVQQ